MLPYSINLHSASSDDLIDWAEILHLHHQFGKLGFRDIGLQLCLDEDIVDLVVLASAFGPVAQVIVALNSGEDDVAELHSRVLAGEASESGKFTCSKRWD